jgi:hypothetical protein
MLNYIIIKGVGTSFARDTGDVMRRERKNERTKGGASAAARRHEKAYGGDVSICLNAGCVMRKKAKCFGFEGCPGFKGK